MKKLLAISLAIVSIASIGAVSLAAISSQANETKAQYYPSTLQIEYINADRIATLYDEYYEYQTLEPNGETTYVKWDTQEAFLIAVKSATFTRHYGNNNVGTFALSSATLIVSRANPEVNFIKLIQTNENNANYSTTPMASPLCFMYGSINSINGCYWIGNFPPVEWNYSAMSLVNVQVRLQVGSHTASPHMVYYMPAVPTGPAMPNPWVFDINGRLGEALIESANNIAQVMPSSLQGADTAFERGYNEGYTAGNNEGYETGESEGYRRGYAEGQSAVSDGSRAVMTLFGAITSVPSEVLNGLSGFTIWNVAIISILITFLIIALIVWAIKRFV